MSSQKCFYIGEEEQKSTERESADHHSPASSGFWFLLNFGVVFVNRRPALNKIAALRAPKHYPALDDAVSLLCRCYLSVSVSAAPSTAYRQQRFQSVK
ncbi:hypothetical protein Pyn_16174 [Prunus yedoensis var. nudiflora]|uniref:Uncharacterized protein n=1 Tax=Prunus yedoensis var. nudiflora TaxID=2094558 RepID=A0A314Y838_PRUYE|nr:hypothetical protein Pyn_16174 [Prunus yedoensis var. nudiflora]